MVLLKKRMARRRPNASVYFAMNDFIKSGDVCLDVIKVSSSGGDQANETLLQCMRLLEKVMHRMPASSRICSPCTRSTCPWLNKIIIDRFDQIRNASLRTLSAVLAQQPTAKTMPLTTLTGIANALLEQRAHKYSRQWMSVRLDAQAQLYYRRLSTHSADSTA